MIPIPSIVPPIFDIYFIVKMHTRLKMSPSNQKVVKSEPRHHSHPAHALVGVAARCGHEGVGDVGGVVDREAEGDGEEDRGGRVDAQAPQPHVPGHVHQRQYHVRHHHQADNARHIQHLAQT